MRRRARQKEIARLRGWLIGALVVSAGLIFGSFVVRWYGQTERLSDPLFSLGSGIVVSCLIALAMDIRIQYGFREELARNTFLALFSQEAPPKYRDAILQYLTSINRVSSRVEIDLDLDWEVEGSIIRLTARRVVHAKNVSGRGHKYTLFWIINSAPPYESELLSLRLEMSDSIGMALPTFALAAEAARSVRRIVEAEGVCYEYGDVLNAELPPGGTIREEVSARVFLPRAAGFPIGTRCAQLATTLRISGNAVKDLDLEVIAHGFPLAPTSRGDEPSLFFDISDAIFPGQTIHLQWAPLGRPFEATGPGSTAD